MTYKELDALLQGRNQQSKKVDNNTWAERRDGCIAIRLHQTDVLTFAPNNRITVTSGGWKTPTTKNRINNFLPDGLRIWQERGTWRWSGGLPFTDGDVVLANGKLKAQKKDDKKEQKLRKQIREYAKLYANAIPMSPPSGGDCWYCCMKTQDGKSLGDATHNTDHLVSHMKEKYVVPSLALSAMRASGFGDALIAGAFSDQGCFSSFSKDRIAKAVARYLYLKFGLVR